MKTLFLKHQTNNNNVHRPNMLSRVLSDGGPGFCAFAITDACNARCAFCNFSLNVSDAASRVYVPIDQACKSIDVLAANGVGYIVFIGGEPTMHPDLSKMLAHAKSCAMSSLVCTNGMLLTRERVEEYVQAGLGSMIISIDAPNIEDHENNRGLPGVCARIAEANHALHDAGVTTTASVTISRLLGDLTKLPGFLKSLNFDEVTFSYPLRSLASTYRSYSDSDLIDYSDEELISMFDQIKALKKKIHVVNPTASLEEMQRFIRGEKQIFPCLAGYKYFFLDWNLDLYRCHAWHEPMCKIFELDSSKLVRDGCTKCMIDCYRDASVLHYLGIALYDARQDISKGNLIKAVTRLFNKPAYHSGKSITQDLKWIKKL